jgi:PncC family amidohydrolase
MSTPAAFGDADEGTRRNRAERVGELALAQGRTIAVAESLTGGMIASALAQAQRASEWFRGSLVAYSTLVKHQLLEVPDGPVVSSDAATAMARSVRKLLLADISVAVTGAGGQPPRTATSQAPCSLPSTAAASRSCAWTCLASRRRSALRQHLPHWTHLSARSISNAEA